MVDTIANNSAGSLAMCRLSRAHESGDDVVRLEGPLLARTVSGVDAKLHGAIADISANKTMKIDVKAVHEIDTAGAWLLLRSMRQARENGGDVTLVGGSKSVLELVDAVNTAMDEDITASGPPRRSMADLMFGGLGRVMVTLRQDFITGMHILGAAVRGSQMKLGHSNAPSMAPIVSQIDVMGIRAMPIIILMSFIIGAIIAQQAAFQLRFFGAEIFVVDLVGILVLRELGVLLTAIMIAGRSGSAITAEIGSMKMREEVDALTVIGLNPVGVLVFPRLVALVIALPLLTIVANAAAMGGGLATAYLYSGITPDAFLARMREAIVFSDFYSGLIKAPFMAMIIGIIASVEGMKVGGSAESLGRCVTASVVKSIFVVIVVDGIFAIYFATVLF